MRIILPSPAKVNLSLWVNGKRADGYHEIVTVFHTINLYDYIWIQPSGHLELSVKGLSAIPTGSGNLVIKACKVFSDFTGIKPKVSIVLEKNIPVGSGLGGGSSNAAAVLRGLNELYGFPLSFEKLLEAAGKIGSDVAFFIKSGLAIGYGRGEKLNFYKPQKFKIILVFPQIPCSTAEVYAKLPEDSYSKVSVSKAEELIVLPLLKHNLRKVEQNMHNDLESSRASCIKEVKKVKEALKAMGLKPLMSGSGSSVFAIVKDSDEVDQTPLKKLGWWTKFCSAV